MNKKGFTLIELLAVIVILAIIALIATPIVLSIINDVKQSAIVRSAEFYVDAVQNKILQENMKLGGKLKPKECAVVSEGKELDCDGTILEIEVEGNTPDEGSLITFDKGKVTSINLIYDNKVVSQNEKGQLVLGDKPKACTLTYDKDRDGIADIGDMIKCSTESFYVIENNGKQIAMFAQYNLDVGNYVEDYYYNCEDFYYEDGAECYCDTDSIVESIENPTNIQNSNAKGGEETDHDNTCRDRTETAYGVIQFSTESYWYDANNKVYIVDSNYSAEGRQCPFVYGDYSQNIIYKYVEQYEEYLKSQNVISASATLISYEQLRNLGCDYDWCIDSPYKWTYSTSYWTGSAYNNISLFGVLTLGLIRSDGYYGSGALSFESYSTSSYLGIRPVVNISVNEL